MSLKNFAPKSKLQSDNHIVKHQADFSEGLYEDIPKSTIPDNAVAKLTNFINHGNRLLGRCGSKEYTATKLPFIQDSSGDLEFAGATKSDYQITVTHGFNEDDYEDYIGYYIYWPDTATYERIESVVDATHINVDTDATHDPSTIKLRGPVNGLFYHKTQKQIILHIDTRIFVSKDIEITEWKQAYCLSLDTVNSYPSQMDELQHYTIIFNSNGIFKLDLTKEHPTFFKLNTPIPHVKLDDVSFENKDITFEVAGDLLTKSSGDAFSANDIGKTIVVNDGIKLKITKFDSITDVRVSPKKTYVAETTGELIHNRYGRRYIYTMSRLGGTGNRNRQTANVEQESGANIANIELLRDYGEQFGAYPISADVPRYVSTLTNPVDPADVDLKQRHWNFYSVYGTTNTAQDAVDPVTGDGNNPEQYMWIEDIPISKPLILDINDTSFTVATGSRALEQFDLESDVTLRNGTTITLTSISTDGLSGTISPLQPADTYHGTIGGGDIFEVTQSGTTLTKTAGTRNFAVTDVGKTAEMSDGTTVYITEHTDDTHVEVLQERDVTDTMTMVLDPESRIFADTLRDDIDDEDITLPFLTSRAADAGLILPTRFWQAIPNCNLGVLTPGFMFGAPENSGNVYYSQVPDGFEYTVGYYNPASQYLEFKDAIKKLKEFPDKVIVYCLGTTHEIPTNTYEFDEVQETGELTAVVSGQNVVDHSIGISDLGNVVSINNGLDCVITSEPEVRFFDGSKYHDSLSVYKINKILRKMHTSYSLSYDAYNGVVLWGLTE